ncbi:MAG: hypothetical protein EOM02_07805 [Synergistales bacterium]|nr:hypothetical protein [Synergistales bacterium]
MMRISEAEHEVRTLFENHNIAPQDIAAFGPDLETVSIYNRHSGVERQTGRYVDGRWELSTGSFATPVLGDVIRFRRQGGNLIWVY